MSPVEARRARIALIVATGFLIATLVTLVTVAAVLVFRAVAG